jgi:hypothetical protein
MPADTTAAVSIEGENKAFNRALTEQQIFVNACAATNAC